MVGAHLNERYRLEAALGRGGMGTVYRGHDTLLDRDVAVKVLGGDGLSSQSRARLLAEAQAAAKLNHPNIVAVYDAGEAGGTPFIVMELVEGESLHERRPHELAEVLSVAQQVCAALDHAHGHGIVHRDLKPENVLLAPGDTAKLTDFGLAWSVTSRLTEEGTLVGTVFYLSPEQALGGPVDGRTDLYALGVMLYELTTGRLPFNGGDPVAVISQHLYSPVVPPRSLRADLPVPLEAAILKLLAKAPDGRYGSASEVGQVLAKIARPPAPLVVDATPGSASLLQQLSGGRLVGRQAELAHLRTLWAQALQGQARLALISGEPGVGKTRLASELMVYARLAGAAVLQGGCSETMMGLPYLPFVEVVRTWVHGRDGKTLRAHLASTAPELARLAPEIEACMGPLPPSPALSPSEERLRLFDHMARFFQSLATGRGLLLFVDDLHWADQGTLGMLRYLLRALRGDPVLILGTYRDTELDRTHPLAAALVEWNRERAASRLPLGRLAPSETAQLLATLFGAEEVTAEFAEAVYGETEGNPFFVEEVVKALVDQGQIYRQEGHWQRLEIAELAIPQSVVEAIGRRLGRLGETCLEVLHTAAPLGNSFSFQELAAVTALGEDRLLDALDEALASQLLRAGEGERFSFTHDKIREVLYRELNPVRRQRLHLRIGEALEALYAANPASHVQALGHHFVQGGDQRRGLDYLRQAAEGAASVYAHDEALALYEQARELAEALDLPEELAAIHEAMARAYEVRGPIDQAVAHYRQALDVTPAAGRARLKVRIGTVYTNVGDERAVDYLQAALDDLDPDTQPNDVARALAALGRFHHYRGQHWKAVEFVERARQLTEPGGDPAALADIYAYLAGAYQHLGLMDDSMAWARRAIALGERMDYPRATNYGYEFLAEDSFKLGRWQEALDYAALSRKLGVRTGAQARVAWAGFSRAHSLYGLGDVAGSVGTAQASLAMAEWIGDMRLAVLAGAILAVGQADLKQDEAARATAALALKRGEELGQSFMQCMGRHALGYVHCQRQEWAPAAALYDECYGILSATDSRLPLTYLGPYHALAHLGLGHLDEAVTSIERLLSAAQELGSRHEVAVGRRVEGQIRMATGEGASAARALDDAVATLRDIGSRLELGRALHQRSRLRRAAGHADLARQDREEALAILEQCGAVRDYERAGAE